MNALQHIRDAGFNVSLHGDSIKINSQKQLTQSQLDFLKTHKAEIINQLNIENKKTSSPSSLSRVSGVTASSQNLNSSSPANVREAKNTLLKYLAAIGEDDNEMINDYLSNCLSNPKVLEEQLQQAKDYLKIESGDTTGMMKCSGCSHLSCDTCNIHGWRVIINKWRRCNDFSTQSNTANEYPFNDAISF